jgi:hypothetical protein
MAPNPSTTRTARIVVTVARALSYLVYAYVVAVEIILGLGFFLLLFGANPSAGFTEWVYRNLARVMAPFRGIFTPIELGTTAGNVPSIFETSVLFAMVVYGILAMLLCALISWLTTKLLTLRAQEAALAANANAAVMVSTSPETGWPRPPQ